MKYAVIRTQGTQYTVAEGDEILINKLSGDLILETLLLVDGEKREIGTPTLPKAKIKAEVMGDEKGKKIHIQKYKAKSRYRKKIGFRPSFTRIKIEKISL